ncbi:MAG: type II toxin-antitoxin system PemK/MazF family toxin [Ignavibacteriales bacterium]|nr:type II toxin-antitoxin system PemK/MazF family toxin [Ignavibacteriales bacterium]
MPTESNPKRKKLTGEIIPVATSSAAAGRKVMRGEVYTVNLDPTMGHEESKTRPCVVVQNNTGNKYSPVTIVAVISSVKKITRPSPVLVFFDKSEMGAAVDGYVDCGQIRTVDIGMRLMDKIATLSPSTMAKVDTALNISLALN